MIDFPTPVEPVTRVKVPRNFNGRNPQMRRDLASALRTKTHNLAPPPPSKDRGAAPRRAGASDPDGADRRAAGPAAGSPVPRLPRPRGPLPLGRALVQARSRHRHAQAPDRAAYQHRGPPVRPGLRGADRPRLPRRREGDRPGPPPDADLLRHGPGGRRGAAARHVGRPHAIGARRRAVGAGLRGAAARRRVVAPDPRRPGQGRDRRDGPPVGRARRSSRRSTTSSSCASPTWASRGSPTGGPRATTSTTCSASPSSRPATSSAG